MSERAIAYVQSLGLTDRTAERVFLLLAERTRADEQSPVMGLQLREVDIPDLAARAGMDTQQFRDLLRALKTMVRMDVLEHDGGWEIVYGPAYTTPQPPSPARTGPVGIGAIQPFTMPGWDDYSTWGQEEGLGHLYAQLYRNGDNPGAAPRIWITPPRYLVQTIDELAAAIASAITPYAGGCVPPEAIKRWLTPQPPARPPHLATEPRGQRSSGTGPSAPYTRIRPPHWGERT
ncbi:hypothetical protein AB0D67_30710 [Streptosporangium sp. NPDC048047]|uniref:hypothetical protein n=1 Tax=Streptosporangium sp. NPDC048047 TaxID=3155748 RepID=UPI00341B8144